MEPMLLIGIGVVALGAVLGAFVMFGQRANPLAETGPTSTLPPDTAPAARPLGARSARVLPESARPPVPPGLRSTDVRIRWYQRLRAGFGLLLLAVGFGMAIGAVIGLGALAVSLYLG